MTCARPKTLYGRPLTGSMLARLACEYCRAMNDNQTPTIKSAWDRVADQQCEEAVDKAVELYVVAVRLLLLVCEVVGIQGGILCSVACV